MKWCTSGAFHLILRVLAWITRKIAKEWGAFMGQSERLYAGKTLLPGQWTVVAITRGGGSRGGGSPPPCRPDPGHKQSHDVPTRQTRAVFRGNVN